MNYCTDIEGGAEKSHRIDIKESRFRHYILKTSPQDVLNASF